MTEVQVKNGISKEDAFHKQEWHDKVKELIESHGVNMWDFDFHYDLCGRGLHELYAMLEMVIHVARERGRQEQIEKNSAELVERYSTELNDQIERQIEKVRVHEDYHVPYFLQVLHPFEGPTCFGDTAEWVKFDSFELAIAAADEIGASIWQDVEGMGRVKVREAVR